MESDAQKNTFSKIDNATALYQNRSVHTSGKTQHEGTVGNAGVCYSYIETQEAALSRVHLQSKASRDPCSQPKSPADHQRLMSPVVNDGGDRHNIKS